MRARVDIDLSSRLIDDERNSHNRWHPDMPPVARVECGQEVTLPLRDALDGQIGPETKGSELAGLDFGVCHPLTGPVFVEGAEPGDVLVVETVAIELPSFGWTFVAPGSGFLPHDDFDPFVARWKIEDGVAQSADVPGVTIRSVPFVGVMGVAPSADRLKQWVEREVRLSATGADVALPDSRSAVPSGTVVAGLGANTNPPRENGGNLDIKHLGVGSRLLLPIDVEGALFSAGDTHFAQGDGESGVTAIEIAAEATFRFDVRRPQQGEWQPATPVVETAALPLEQPGPWFVTTGIPVDARGENHDNDLGVAARNACREMIRYLGEVRGYTREQAYVLLSVAVDLRLSQVVNSPNPVVSAVLPLGIFDA